MKNGILPFFIFGVLRGKTPGGLSQPASLPARLQRQTASCHFSSSGFIGLVQQPGWLLLD
jgi:hypothetical protein